MSVQGNKDCSRSVPASVTCPNCLVSGPVLDVTLFVHLALAFCRQFSVSHIRSRGEVKTRFAAPVAWRENPTGSRMVCDCWIRTSPIDALLQLCTTRARGVCSPHQFSDSRKEQARYGMPEMIHIWGLIQMVNPGDPGWGVRDLHSGLFRQRCNFFGYVQSCFILPRGADPCQDLATPHPTQIPRVCARCLSLDRTLTPTPWTDSTNPRSRTHRESGHTNKNHVLQQTGSGCARRGSWSFPHAGRGHFISMNGRGNNR